MIIGSRRAMLLAAIAVIAIAIISLPLITLYTAPDMDKIVITLSDVRAENIIDQNNTIDLGLSFSVYNPTDKALTTSKIEYRLYGNGILLGENVLSYEDIPLNGRPQLLPNTNQTLSTLEPLRISLTSENQPVINQIIDDKERIKDIAWKTDGDAQIESAFSFTQKPFSSEIKMR